MNTNKCKDIYKFNKEMSLILERSSLEDTLIEFEPLISSIVDSICCKLNCNYRKDYLLESAKEEFLNIYNSYNCNTNGTFNHFAKKRLFSLLYPKALSQLDIIKTE